MLDYIRGLISKNGKELNIFADDGIARLESISDYRHAYPYPHAVIDNLFNPNALRAVLKEWPESDSSNSDIHNDGVYVRKKVGTNWKTKFGPVTKKLFYEVASPIFLRALEKMTGMWGLIPDPYMLGGGLHATGVGGTLAIHSDFNKHPFFKIDRRLNVLVYLNEGWKPENGGALELWDADMKACRQKILPIFNRTVIFSTTSNSFHGHTEPVAGPPDMWRKSIALYYFSNGRADEGFPPDDSGSHSTLWQKRPEGEY
ncbi:2OG-Fe(II) oxygenase [Burkholderia sp. BC1]|uniref:2OG-Fe(II) oxygenase n=1 Tax=Burkholderia sp. BC1 TaxID=1095370 RepID=UPI0040447A3B